MSDENTAIVLGAGVVGLSTALYLRRAGRDVTVIDPLPPGGGASYGNAGMISADTASPIAMPGMLRQVPGWLRDKKGPLVVHPSYLPTALPWLMRWIKEGRIDRVLAISDALRALHKDAFACWQDLIGPQAFGELVRRTGQIQVWDGEGESAGARVERQIRERHGIEAQVLGADDLQQMVPGISRAVRRALLVPGNGYTVSPARLVGALAERLRGEGGTIVAERALKLIPREGGGFTVWTNVANRAGADVVVAGGAWSKALLDPLGVRVPLETERGYHAMLPTPSIEPRYTISYKSRGFGVTPMEGGLRAAGTVEFAGLDAPPDETRARILAEHARALFPGLTHGEPQLWLGFRPSLPDTLPVLGPVPQQPGLHLAFGHGHYGMTAGPPSGRLVATLMAQRAAPIDPAPYAVGRFAS
ncbi:FAD-dependent oxidoreductase [Methylobacterium sp. J-072]|uniref:NAD(P)/FAD-dependent oxidoreductase n=1 Tax=Methylobacterium sp. J-072 TaxID=2836651 RepID=UPI001FB93415|nr:FAD-dependent oxidoreductase [Methylobacterium sp. J-072]MCJ2090910.1 FAD-dependent oxidoreductase [Methylobacterium sp. J-072]